MKTCPYCGQEYSDDYSTCPIDENPLESTDPKPPAPAPASEPAPVAPPQFVIAHSPAESAAPHGFRSFGRFDPFEAEHLLKKFTDAGVRFQIDNIQKRVFTPGGLYSGPGYVTKNWIEIFVSLDDEKKATKILTADWKV